MPGVQLVRSFFGLLEPYPKVQRHRSELEMYISILDKMDYSDAHHKQAGDDLRSPPLRMVHHLVAGLSFFFF
ncbi:hypothetical protein gpAD87_30330 [Paenibacillus sp. AD87]|nr:hypothetical protein gpAD87_30330 [Paenibacillus sp. AD87]